MIVWSIWGSANIVGRYYCLELAFSLIWIGFQVQVQAFTLSHQNQHIFKFKCGLELVEVLSQLTTSSSSGLNFEN